MAIEPVTREERFLAAAGGRSVTTPEPITRKEQLLQGIIDAVKSGGATPDVIEGAVNDYLNANPVKPGATTEQAAQIEQNKTDIADLQTDVDELKESGGNGSGQNAALTTAQVNALHGMFKVCLFDDSRDVDGAISAFETAFGIVDSGGGEIPNEPDQPGGEGGGTTGDALPTDGLMAYFDLRNLGDKANVTVGAAKGVVATQGNGALYSWASQPITSSDEYGAVLPRGLLYNPSGQSAEYDMGDHFTMVVTTRGDPSGWNMTGSNVVYGIAEPVYVTADGTAKAAKIEITGDKTGYNTQTYRINGETQTMYLNGIKIAEYVGSETDGFVKWESKPTFGTIWSAGTVVAATVYNRPLSETEIVEVQAFMKSLEVNE